MSKRVILICIAAIIWIPQARAQVPVTGVESPEKLFASPDPKLNRNKQAALGIVRDLLEANHWELADRYLTERYIQHNPLAASGRQGVVDFFTKTLAVRPSPIPTNMKTAIVSVVAEGDYVVVTYPRTGASSANPSRRYSTTWFDMWRFVDGKADEHWDPQTLP